MKPKIIYLLIAFAVFCSLVYYNYLLAQKNIRETRPAPLGIVVESYPEELILGESAKFVWTVISSPDQFTPRTTIYWGYAATPSALLTSDSPEAVSYAYHQDDYFTGTFKLPDTFEENIPFPKQGTIYFRAYAKVGQNHLWSEEKTLKVVTP